MTRLTALTLCCAAGLAGGAQDARGAFLVYTAALDGQSEAPPNASPGVGFATVTIDDVNFTMRVQATFSGLIGNTTAAHIHAATANPLTGTAGVATQVPSFSGFPLGVKAGSMDTTFDLNVASSYNPSYITNNGGTVASARAALLAAIDQERSYFNIHTSFVPGGEIRGFLQPTPAPPGVILLGVGGVCLLARRRWAGAGR
jgi:hypothetical protein